MRCYSLASITRTPQPRSPLPWPRPYCLASHCGASEGFGSPVIAGRCSSATCYRPSHVLLATLQPNAPRFSSLHRVGKIPLYVHQSTIIVHTRHLIVREVGLSRALSLTYLQPVLCVIVPGDSGLLCQATGSNPSFYNSSTPRVQESRVHSVVRCRLARCYLELGTCPVDH